MRTLPAKLAARRSEERDAALQLADSLKVDEWLRAALIEAFSRLPRESIHPMLLENAERKRRELRLKEQAATLERREHRAVIEKTKLQVELLKNRLQNLTEKASKGRPLNLADIRKIKAIYGIRDDANNEPAGHQE